MSNKKDLQALAETLVEEFYETQGAGVLKNLNKRTYGNLINGREDVLNSMKACQIIPMKKEKRSGRKKRKRSCIW